MKPQIIFIDGPRQVGKTFLINSMAAELVEKRIRSCSMQTNTFVKLEQKTSESDTTSMLEHISRWSSVIESIISAMSHQHYSIMFVDGGLHGHMTNWLINEKTPKQLEYLASIYKNILNLYQDRYDFRHISLLETFNPDLPEPENLVFWDHALEMLYHFRQPGFDNLPIEHIGLTSNSGHAIVGDYTAENFQLKGNEDEHASLFH